MKNEDEEVEIIPDWVLDRDTVSQSVYLYGCEAYEFDLPIEVQKAFLKEREDKLEVIIGHIYEMGMDQRDEERLRTCLESRSWINKMYISLGGR